MFCPQCGKQNSDHANFCENCGSPIFHPTPSPVSDIPSVEPVETMIDDQITDTAAADLVKDNKKGLAIIGLVLSCVGLGISAIFYMLGGMMLGIPLCVAGVILSAVSMKSVSSKALSITAFLVGIVGVVIGLLMMLAFFTMLDGNSDIAYYFEEFFNY